MVVKYKMVSDVLEKEILEGIYKDTGKIPTEEEIGKRFNVSRNTVRKAIDNLVKRGYLYQIQGSGVFVRDNEDANFDIINLHTMYGLTKGFSGKRLVRTELIDFKIIKSDEYLSKKMKCDINTDIYFVNRIRYIDDKIYCIEYSYFNKEYITYLDEDIAKKSIYEYIMNDLGLGISVADRVISCENIDKEDAKVLELENNICLVSENKAYLNNGKIFDYSKDIINYKSFKLAFLSNSKF